MLEQVPTFTASQGDTRVGIESLKVGQLPIKALNQGDNEQFIGFRFRQFPYANYT